MTKAELVELIANSVGISVEDIHISHIDYNTGALRIALDNVDIEPSDDDEEENLDDDLDDSDDDE